MDVLKGYFSEARKGKNINSFKNDLKINFILWYFPLVSHYLMTPKIWSGVRDIQVTTTLHSAYQMKYQFQLKNGSNTKFSDNKRSRLHNEIYRVQRRTVFLTCCDNKKQQTSVELHFQSWDISVSETLIIPNPYRFLSDSQYLCVMMRTSEPRKMRKMISSFPADSPNKTERRQKLSFSIISS